MRVSISVSYNALRGQRGCWIPLEPAKLTLKQYQKHLYSILCDDEVLDNNT